MAMLAREPPRRYRGELLRTHRGRAECVNDFETPPARIYCRTPTVSRGAAVLASGWLWSRRRAGRRRVDPGGSRDRGRRRRAPHEPLGMGGVGRGEDLPARGADDLDLPVVHHRRGQPADTAVAMLGVVPGEERMAEGAGGFHAGKARRKLRPGLEGLELRLGERVVIG